VKSVSHQSHLDRMWQLVMAHKCCLDNPLKENRFLRCVNPVAPCGEGAKAASGRRSSKGRRCFASAMPKFLFGPVGWGGSHDGSRAWSTLRASFARLDHPGLRFRTMLRIAVVRPTLPTRGRDRNFERMMADGVANAPGVLLCGTQRRSHENDRSALLRPRP
jgi:hypothetical protein